MSKIKRIIPALGLRGLKNAELTSYADKRITDLIRDASSFPDLKPGPLEVNDVNQEYKRALSAPRSKSNTTVRKRVRRALEIILIRCAQQCAFVSENELAVYVLSGFDYKRNRGIDQSLLALQILRIDLGINEGELIVHFKTVKNACSYEVCYGLRDAQRNSWIATVSASSGKVFLDNLESGLYYKVRVRGVFGNNRYSPWSNTIIKKTY
ncbi:MAG: fibronectin type III domain-containing protein [Bacteroidota bacterium]